MRDVNILDQRALLQMDCASSALPYAARRLQFLALDRDDQPSSSNTQELTVDL